MTKRIEKRIVRYSVVKPDEEARASPEPQAQDNVVQMHEKVERPEMLFGSTYKIKTPLSEHALYVTINDIVLNQGTEHELPLRDLHQLEEHGPLPVDRGPDPDHVGGVSQGGGLHLPGRRTAVCI